MNKRSFRQKRNYMNKRSFTIIFILCIGIGFALLSSNLTIIGNTTVSKNKWSIYFDNVDVKEGSVEASIMPTTTGKATTSIEYTVLLDKPGDFYEFSVDAVNDGTIDAMIENIDMTNLEENVSRYLSYTATYLDGTPLAKDDILTNKSTVTYKVRIEYKKDISSYDLTEEGVNLTLTFGVNYIQSNRKKVESNFTKLIKNNALSDQTINFSQISSESNGRGLYVMESTKTDNFPIYYYRGAVQNNNAKFAGFCWKIVRTTDTGGTKLVYNGLPKVTYPEYEKLEEYDYIFETPDESYEFDDTNKKWMNLSQGEEKNIEFSVPEAGDYNLKYKIESTSDWIWGIETYFYKDGVEIGSYNPMEDYGAESEGSIFLENLTTSNILSIRYGNYGGDESYITFYLEKGIGESTIGCTNTTGDATQISMNEFNPSSISLAYVGYMYGNVYESLDELRVYNNYNYIFGSDFEFTDVDPNVSGDGTYTLKNTSTDMTQMSTYHYTCFNTTGTCSELYYIYFTYNITNPYYISLKDGKSVEDALNDMKINTTNSTIKTTIDTWFNNTFKTYFTNQNKNYNDYLEDTIWCSDRNKNTLGNQDRLLNNGWNPNGGDTKNEFYYYSPYGRIQAGSPSLTCESKNDSFTVTESESGNGALSYPVGLLTSDEVMMAGGQLFGTTDENTDFYLYNHRYWWTMSPGYFQSSSACVMMIDWYGSLGSSYVGNNNDESYFYGVRPSISLKPSVKVAPGGNGSSIAPYEFVVE